MRYSAFAKPVKVSARRQYIRNKHNREKIEQSFYGINNYFLQSNFLRQLNQKTLL
jgi:hypothetical protein